MAKTEDKLHKQHCQSCDKDTNHTTLCSHTETGDEDYNYARVFSVVQCCGCEFKSFRQVFIDYESSYPVSDHYWEAPQDVDVYPKYVKGHSEISGLTLAPDIVQSIYSETLSALQEGANTLAGLGLRGTIEAICNEQAVKGKNLEVRISGLQKAGLISIKDAERLHAIRFLGNDAAHEIRKPSDNQILVALEIIDHLIASIYILDYKMEGSLDTLVTKYDKFVSMLDSKIESLTKGDELPIAGIIQKDMRRVAGALSTLQSKLIEQINHGEYKKLSIGKVAKYMGSDDELQHFIIQ